MPHPRTWIAALLLATACATPRSPADWFERAADLHLRAAPAFPAAAAILQGFDEPGGPDRIEDGDRLLYGIHLEVGGRTDSWLVLFEVEHAIATVDSDGQPLPIEGRARAVVTPKPRRTAEGTERPAEPKVEIDFTSRYAVVTATVFDAEGGVVSRDDLLVSRFLMSKGIYDGCRVVAADRGDGPRDEATWKELGYTVFACLEFLKLIRGCKGLNEILEQAMVVDLWSVLFHFGVEVSCSLDVESGTPFTLPRDRGPDADAFRFPLSIGVNGAPALDCSIVVGRTGSPLNLGAGVLSVVGVRPGDDTGRVTMTLLAARRGGAEAGD
ncbi:MAG: hypothetical protein R3F30_07090 [Planctomycetota bacterium]